MIQKSWSAIVAALLPTIAWADPLDTGEAYTTRKGPPEWMNGIDFTWLLVDYGLFALSVIALGWMLLRRPEAFARFESMIQWPFVRLLEFASRMPAIVREPLRMVVGVLIILLIAGWVIFCQWLKHTGLGALSMAGLALLAILLVRLVKTSERHQGEQA